MSRMLNSLSDANERLLKDKPSDRLLRRISQQLKTVKPVLAELLNAKIIADSPSVTALASDLRKIKKDLRQDPVIRLIADGLYREILFIYTGIKRELAEHDDGDS